MIIQSFPHYNPYIRYSRAPTNNPLHREGGHSATHSPLGGGVILNTLLSLQRVFATEQSTVAKWRQHFPKDRSDAGV
ncbi:hypothetical protein E2C01_043381 [Portunus trituberculatus]|uniref:Uncharacterized protein n=1 Tax=Portunus trituberculatus TaxID=210409 RepID=A0A5B7FZE4_PORTR|nr:hypothetical protein [Portunus trituberculatus]